MSVSSKKQYIDVFLLLIEDAGDGKYMEELTHLSQFLFIYNSMTNTNLNSSYAFNEFVSSQIITMQFQVYSLNFRTIKKLDSKFKYTFWLISVYLVQPIKKSEISTPSRRKCDSDKWIILPFRTKNASKVVNLLEQPITSYASQNALHTKGLQGSKGGFGKKVDDQEDRKKTAK